VNKSTFCSSFFVAQTHIGSFPQEHHVLTSHGPISVAVYGDLEKPALVTYPDVALNRKLDYITFFKHFFICRAFKGCFFVQKLLLCCFIISAYTILVLQVMRSVILLQLIL
ncbi:hypothetical protein B296_00016433, partial [Ensete ventricosum]